MNKQLIFEKIEPYHRRFLYPFYSDVEICKHLHEPFSESQYQRQFDQMLRDRLSKHWIVKMGDDKSIVGVLSILFHSELERYEIECRVLPGCWHKGIGRSSIAYGIKHGFKHMKLKEIYGVVHPDNIFAKALANGLGMTQLMSDTPSRVTYKLMAMCTL